MVGAEGQGWSMVTGELAFERSGPDRFLSDYRLLVELIDRVGPQPESTQQAVEIGRFVAHLAALQRMSASIAGLLDQGKSPNTEAALVKDVGTAFERELPEMARRLRPGRGEPGRSGRCASPRRSRTSCCTRPPSRCAAARARSCAASSRAASDCVEERPMTEACTHGHRADELSAIVSSRPIACSAAKSPRNGWRQADRGEWPAAIWNAVEQAGLPLALVPEAHGGVGLPPADALRLIRRAGYHTLPVPLAETMIAAALWTRGVRRDASTGTLSLAPAGAADRIGIERRARRLRAAWARHSASRGARRWTMFWCMRATETGSGHLALLPRGARADAASPQSRQRAARHAAARRHRRCRRPRCARLRRAAPKDCCSSAR